MKRRKFLAFLGVGTVAASIVKGLSERKSGVIITSSPTELSDHKKNYFNPETEFGSTSTDLRKALINRRTVKISVVVYDSILFADLYEMTGIVASYDRVLGDGPDYERAEIQSVGKQDDRKFPAFFCDTQERISMGWRDGQEHFIAGRKSRSITIINHNDGWHVEGYGHISATVEVVK